VIVVLDGPDGESAALCAAFETRGRFALRVIEAERRGNAYTKNVGIEAARGQLTVFLNDDVRPVPRFLERHIAAHTARDGHPALVLGHSPWTVHRPDRLFDRLLRETSMVFFYDRMVDRDGVSTEPEGHDWGFRHAWTLNLSGLTECVRRVGGFDESLANCCFEDVEFGWRFTRMLGAPVLFRADAVADHDHRYGPVDYLRREFRLGYSAWGLAMSNPQCARAVFRRDLREPGEVSRCREQNGEEARLVPEWRAWFESLAGASAEAVGGGVELGAIYERHLPLKRHEFRRGLLAAADGEIVEGLYPARLPASLSTAPGD